MTGRRTFDPRRVVVGVDGSAGSRRALRWALDLALMVGAEVDAVYAWELSYGWIDGYFPDLARWLAEAERMAHRDLDEAVAACVGPEHEQVKVTRSVVQGPATSVLLGRAEGADLLVLGTRGRGGFASLLLGSVSHQCVHHATVPVVVVPPVAPAEPESQDLRPSG